MSKFVIEGGHPLEGTVAVSGNKNSALKLLAACLLTDEPVTLHNVPDIEDVRVMIQILQDMGVEMVNLAPNSWRIQAQNIVKTAVDARLAGRIRASFVLSGPMLGRLGRITLPFPGGDMIGGRPLDTHIQGLRALGATTQLDQTGIFHVQADQLRGGGYILQAEASVTATENTLMAAVLAKGETIIDNAAREPHVQDLGHLLVQMGAQIEGIGTSRLTVQGVEKLRGAEFRVGADFMEVGSFIGAAAVTGSTLRITNAEPRYLHMIRLVYEKMGVRWQEDGCDIVVPADQELVIQQTLAGRTAEIKPMPWPGFPPDLMSIAVVIASQSQGAILLHDWMYESRFFFTDKLIFMGARVVLCDPHRIIVQGCSPLVANPNGVTSPDIRAGMAMLLAALCAQGTSTIHNIQQIDRGYERVEEKLRAVGANIRRVA